MNVIQFGSIESKELKKLAIKCGGIYQQTAHNVDALLVLQLKKGKPVKTYTSGKINKY